MILTMGRTTIPASVDVLGLPVQPYDRQSLIETVATRACFGLPTRIGYLNAHTFNLCATYPRLRTLLAKNDLLYADGMSIVWASKLVGQPVPYGQLLPERLSLSTYVFDLMRAFAERDVSVFLVGGLPGIAQGAAKNLTDLIPDLNIAGTANGFSDTRNADQLIERINAARPGVLMLGMGSPLQEEWLEAHGAKLDVPVQWVVGAVFDFLAGKEPHAPQWMCRIGLQWSFRLAMDPLGKWRRYLLGNPVFAGHVLSVALDRWLGKQKSKRMAGGDIS